MKISSRKVGSLKKPALVAMMILAILIGAGSYYFFIAQDHVRDTNDVDYQPRTARDKREAAQVKDEVITKNESRENDSPSPTNPELSIVINRVSQDPQGNLNVRSIISGASSGMCSAIFFNDSGDKFTRTFEVNHNTNYPACNLDLPLSDFPSKGQWSLKLSFAYSDTRSNEATQSFEVK